MKILRKVYKLNQFWITALVFTFQFFNDKVYSNTKKTFGTWPFHKIGVLVNLVIQKSKSKHLNSLSQFSLVTTFFEGTSENILHIFRALASTT